MMCVLMLLFPIPASIGLTEFLELSLTVILFELGLFMIRIEINIVPV